MNKKLKTLQKILEICGENHASAQLNKISQIIEHATSWDEYSSQGPAYQAIQKWWESNHNKIPGNYNNSYTDWTDWYMNHYNNDWSNQHKGPEEAIELMKAESDPSYKPQYPYQTETYKEKNNLFQKKNIHSIRGNTLDGSDLIPINSRNFGSGTGRKLNSIQGGKIDTYAGVNLERITPQLREFITILGNTAEQMGAEIPIITSGWRSFEKQAEIMANNWQRNGGMNGGLEYLINIYGRRYGTAMHQIFSTYGTGSNALQYAIEEIKKHPGDHVADIGRGIDLNPTRGIELVLKEIKKNSPFHVKIVDETNTAGPHYHVQIK